MAPWNLCSKLLHNFTVRPGLGKGAHVLEIASRVTRELRKLPLKVVGKTVDDLRAPALAFLTNQDIASNFPIMQDKLGIGCERGFYLGCPDALLDRFDEALINCAAGWCTIAFDARFRFILRGAYRNEISRIGAGSPSLPS